MAVANRDITALEATRDALETRAEESAEVRDLLAAAMTTKFTPVSLPASMTRFPTALSVSALLVFLIFLWHSLRR